MVNKIETFQDLIDSKKELKDEINTLESEIKNNKIVQVSNFLVGGKLNKVPNLESFNIPHIKDIVDINLKTTETPYIGIFNIGTGIQHSIQTLYTCISGQFSHTTPLNYRPSKSAEVMHNALDSTKAMNTFDWNPKYSLEQGIQEMIETLKEKE